MSTTWSARGASSSFHVLTVSFALRGSRMTRGATRPSTRSRTRRSRSDFGMARCAMDLETDNGEILQRWLAERSILDVEITVGHVSMRFTGHVKYLSATELLLSNDGGELSISLFCAG